MASKEYTGDEFYKVWNKEPWECRGVDGDKWKIGIGTPGFYRTFIYRTTGTTPDTVNRPSHYYVKAKLPKNATVVDGIAEIDCFAVSDALEFHKHHYIASAFAYVWRCLKKNNTVEDLRKAVVYLNKEIELRSANVLKV